MLLLKTPWRWRAAVQQYRCDIAIIGSGIGGLAAGALLSKAGYRVFVAEQMPFFGGRCATLDFQGYKIDTGVSLVVDELHGALCREVGVDFEFRAVDPLLVCHFKGKDYPFNTPEGMVALINEASRDDAEAGRVFQALMNSVMWAEPSSSMSFLDWVTQYTDNPDLLAVFQCLVTSIFGLRLSEVPAGAYFRMIAEMEKAGLKTSGFPLHGGGAVSDALVKAIRARGSEVRRQSAAVRINVDNGRATGVLVRRHNGQEWAIQAQAVISNAGPRQTVELVGQEHLSAGYVKEVESLKSVPIIRIVATSDEPLMEGSSVRLLTEARRLLLVWTPSNGNPHIAPEGKHMLAGFAFPASALPPFDFEDDIELCLQDLRDFIPEFHQRAEVLRVDTFHGDWPEYGTHSGYGLPLKTPVEDLYLVGDTTAPIGWFGSPASVMSARLAAADVMERHQPLSVE
jgi:phytoene dehydrogenase-like protein